MDSILEFDVAKRDEFYEILGCDELSTTEQITQEYKVRAKELHPDKNPGSKDAAARFARLQQAKDVLCDEEKRRDYDAWRRSGMCMPYEEWCSRKECLKTSMHWAFVQKKDAAIEPPPHHTCAFETNSMDIGPSWARDHVGDSLQMFRNYEI